MISFLLLLSGLVVFILFCARQEDVRKSIKPHYSRLTGMLPISGRPSTVTAYSLTSRSAENTDQVRKPLRTAELSAGTYSHKITSSSSEETRMISKTDNVDDHVSDYHDL